ncbi:glucocorticoid-induced transcript 1 protein-like [Limanda limanda]|uniref:glucocorticoid-induced transcript 1 protein-like n=1 Tax=Limanda limanda TaxID=27771 RepID=UPI0029C7C520|nr:glucocorticoid-induced transcript 1 protein-like [Limanda limanda]
MSGRTGAPQPLKATVPYQLTGRPRTQHREGKSAGTTTTLHQLSSGMRRTMSLDAIIGPYLQGHWPKEPEGQSSPSCKDKSTQTPDSWSDGSQSRRGSSSGSHKRSASWSSDEHLREIAKLKQQLQQRNRPALSGGHDKNSQRGYPQRSCSLGTTQTQSVPIPLAPLSTLVPRLRCSVEGLNQELEGMFICQPLHPQHRLLEVPDGHRAPVPRLSCSSGSQSDPITPTLSSCSPSPCSSPCYISSSPPYSGEAPVDRQQGSTDSAEMCLLSKFSCQNEADLPLPLLISSSPGPNKSSCFQREPPEGCEKVRVWEETSTRSQSKPTLFSSCPDPNKVNFTPHGGSAFWPVSLLRPLLPSMDLLFRSLAISPAGSCSNQGTISCQAASSENPSAASDPPAAAAATVGESSGRAFAF